MVKNESLSMTNLEALHGTRLQYFDQIRLPKAWVVNGKLPKEITDLMHADVVPLMVIEAQHLSLDAIFIREYVREIKKKFGSDAVFLLVPDAIDESGYSCGAIMRTDLRKYPSVILAEYRQAMSVQNFDLIDTKRLAYLAKTGERNVPSLTNSQMQRILSGLK